MVLSLKCCRVERNDSLLDALLEVCSCDEILDVGSETGAPHAIERRDRVDLLPAEWAAPTRLREEPRGEAARVEIVATRRARHLRDGRLSERLAAY